MTCKWFSNMEIGRFCKDVNDDNFVNIFARNGVRWNA